MRAKDLSRSFDLFLHSENLLIQVKTPMAESNYFCPCCEQRAYYWMPNRGKGKSYCWTCDLWFKALNTKDFGTVFNNFLSLFKDVVYARSYGNYFKLLSVLLGLQPAHAESMDVHMCILNFWIWKTLYRPFPWFPSKWKIFGIWLKSPCSKWKVFWWKVSKLCSYYFI